MNEVSFARGARAAAYLLCAAALLGFSTETALAQDVAAAPPAPAASAAPAAEPVEASAPTPEPGQITAEPTSAAPRVEMSTPPLPTLPASAVAGPSTAEAKKAEAPKETKKDIPWYERLKIRGYTQFRYNRIPTFNDNDDLTNSQGDRTIGGENGFSIRRARLIIYGDVHEYVSIYLQPDFASVIDEQLNVAIMRDWYADLYLMKSKELRLRVGQSKVPFGFENLQSSQNRLPFDRSDATNSAVKDERDLGAFAYWAPAEIRQRFKHLVDSGLKGSGDYGVLALGVYNGQTANKSAVSDDMHVVGRVTWPFKFGEQFVEIGGGGYYGQYRVSTNENYELPEGSKITDARGIANIMLYPQPFGLALEGNLGVGPSQGDAGAPDENVIKSRKLGGGYGQLMYKVDDLWGTVALLPYARATYYDGGKKFEKNAPHYVVKEIELGLEWQIFKALEVVLAYDLAERTKDKTLRGHVGRIQVQVNY